MTVSPATALHAATVQGEASAITLAVTAPTKPTITSTTFVQDTLPPADATQGEFTLASVGATSFDYYWNGVREGNLPVNSTSGVPAWTGDLALPDSAVAGLQAIAIDDAGNHSPTSAAFYVKKAVGGKLAEYLFNDPTPTDPAPFTVANSAGDVGAADPIVPPADKAHHPFDMTTDAGWGAGKFTDLTGNGSLSLAGTGEEAHTTGPPALSSRSFTIGGWVKLADHSASRTVIAQDLQAAPADPDAATAAYDIGYDQASGRFVFHVTTTTGATVTASDALPASVRNPSNGEVIKLPHTGAWVYLAAIYDGNRDPLSDPSTSAREVSIATPVSLGGAGVVAGRGAFRVGDGGLDRSPWAGLVDNVSVWQQALSDGTSNDEVGSNAENHI